MDEIYLFTVVLSAILLSAHITNISVHAQEIPPSQPNGRLLTPDEGCGIMSASNTKIVGGVEAMPGAFPWIAIIGQHKMYDGNLTQFSNCGGSLITSRHILTAAHCVNSDMSFVRLGEHDLNSTADGEHEDIKVIHWEIHPNFDDNDNTNDIAILILERDVVFTNRIRPICLPLTQDTQSKSYIGSHPFVAGWGLLKENGMKSRVLMQTQLPVIDNQLCKEQYVREGEVYSSVQFSELVLCAGHMAGGRDTCLGDSGGPLMLPILQKGPKFPMYQIGVISYGIGCGRPNMPGVNTRVSMFIEWIQEIIQTYNSDL